ncbi:hypothetical protein M9Y10_038752 [Tritrichomonas musculus]|uniref:Uncharacterized protein n=1 Tax=Tritrichomonas musculus TaxID=1915356 RepID=A0ABR2KA02_9EUKA
MQNRIDQIETKIINLRKMVRDYGEGKTPKNFRNSKTASKSAKISKRKPKQKKIYDEIPQEVLDKSYSIYRSSKFLEKFFENKYFNKWISRYFEIQPKRQNNELNEPKEHSDHEEININKSNDINENSNIDSSTNIGEIMSDHEEEEQLLSDLNDEYRIGLDEHTEDKSKISLPIDDEDFSHENL